MKNKQRFALNIDMYHVHETLQPRSFVKVMVIITVISINIFEIASRLISNGFWRENRTRKSHFLLIIDTVT